eukprot:m.377693 g.377693  ORF g.377693 m.377693 type:complete len:396 (+) comp20926_c2_seq11:178-1365(+)
MFRSTMKTLFVLLPFMSLAFPSPAQSADTSCSLLGTKVDGKCVCDPGWKGEDCATMDLAPVAAISGYINHTYASWGGRPLFANGKWHLFATEITLQCPLILFMNNSQVIHAVSSQASGPYSKRATVLPPFHHNPTAVGPTPDGYYLLFFIGADQVNTQIDCSRGIPKRCTRDNNFCRGKSNPVSNEAITMAYATSVDGPWKTRVILPRNPDNNTEEWNCGNNNPSAHVLSNGTVVLVYRANPCTGKGGESLGIAIADHWNASYVRRKGGPIVSPNDGTGNHEDPFVWADARGNWHIISHDQSKGNVCGSADNHGCGAHLFSRDTYSWTVSKNPAYSTAVHFTNGTIGRLQTRQRPQVIFSTDGAMRPTHLFNAASFEGNNPDLNMLTHTMAFAFN